MPTATTWRYVTDQRTPGGQPDTVLAPGTVLSLWFSMWGWSSPPKTGILGFTPKWEKVWSWGWGVENVLLYVQSCYICVSAIKLSLRIPLGIKISKGSLGLSSKKWKMRITASFSRLQNSVEGFGCCNYWSSTATSIHWVETWNAACFAVLSNIPLRTHVKKNLTIWA